MAENVQGVTIAHIRDLYQKDIAESCDKNGDGKLTGQEISIWQAKTKTESGAEVSQNGNTTTIAAPSGVNTIRRNPDGSTLSEEHWDNGYGSAYYDSNGIKRSETHSSNGRTTVQSYDKNGDLIQETTVNPYAEDEEDVGGRLNVDG